MTYDASNRKHVRQAEKLARISERQRLAHIREQMSTPPGRRYMYEKLEVCHIFHSCFNTNALTMAVLEGERNIGLMFLNDIMAACPEQYINMVREANERTLAVESSADRNGDPDTEPEPGTHPTPGDD